MDGPVIIVGAVVVIVVAAILVVLFLKKANTKYGELWAPLATMVGGSSKGAKLTGTLHGVPLTARINAVSDDTSTDYFYELTLTPGAEGQDWALSYTGEKLLGMGAKSWQIKTKDEALKQRLAAAGAITTVEQWTSYPAVSYKAKSGTLEYATKVRGMYAIPSAEEFTQQLDLMHRLAHINQQANSAAPAVLTGRDAAQA